MARPRQALKLSLSVFSLQTMCWKKNLGRIVRILFSQIWWLYQLSFNNKQVLNHHSTCPTFSDSQRWNIKVKILMRLFRHISHVVSEFSFQLQGVLEVCSASTTHASIWYIQRIHNQIQAYSNRYTTVSQASQLQWILHASLSTSFAKTEKKLADEYD